MSESSQVCIVFDPLLTFQERKTRNRQAEGSGEKSSISGQQE